MHVEFIGGGVAKTMADDAQMPVLLVHGIDSRDEGFTHSRLWGRIPDALRDAGYLVFFGYQDAWGTIRSNAQQLARSIERAAARSSSGQAVIIAHSKGGLDSAAACRLPGVADKVKTLITLSTPHQGMAFCDWLLRSRFVIPRVAAPFMNIKAKLMGDDAPDSYSALQALGAQGRANMEGHPYAAPLLSLGFDSSQPKGLVGRVVRKLDGPNDGLVPLCATNAGIWKRVHVLDDIPFLHTDCVDARGCNTPLELDGMRFPSIVELICHLARQASKDHDR